MSPAPTVMIMSPGWASLASSSVTCSSVEQYTAPGIWAASGTHDVEVKPVLMFVRTPSYKPRISMDAIAKQADLQNDRDKRVRFRLREAAGV